MLCGRGHAADVRLWCGSSTHYAANVRPWCRSSMHYAAGRSRGRCAAAGVQ